MDLWRTRALVGGMESDVARGTERLVGRLVRMETDSGRCLGCGLIVGRLVRMGGLKSGGWFIGLVTDSREAS